MPNVLTALQPILFSVAQEVSAEPFGVVSAINANFDDKGVAKGDQVKVPVAPTRTAEDFTPGNVTPTGADTTAEDVAVEITHSRKVSWHLTGEQQRSLDNGATSTEWIRQLVAQGMRTLRNEAERSAALAIKQGASRAVGTAGGSPFATNLDGIVDLRKVLADNGAPMADLQLVFDTTDGAALRKLGIVQQADQAGTAEERRTGRLLRQFGFELRESAGIVAHTPGTGSGYLLDSAAAAQAREITVDTGTGTILPGDVISFAADSANKYVAGGLSGTDLLLNRSGLRGAIPDNNAISVSAAYTPIFGFERSAVVGVMRPPLMPANPTITQMLVSDGEGMTYLMLDISQYGQRTWELHLAWGFKVVQQEHVALLLS